MTYERQIASAQKLIAKFGGDCSYITAVKGDPTDSATPWRATAVEETTIAVKAAIIPYGTQSRPSLSQGDRTNVATNQAYIAAADMGDVQPKIGDSLLRENDTTKYRVTSVDTYNINGEVIMHVLEVVAA